MDDAGTYGAGCLLIAFACYRVVVGRRGAPDPALRYICWFALSIGAALLVLAPATLGALGGFGPAPRAAVLLGAELKLSGLTALALFARALGEPGTRTARTPARQGVAAGAALAALFVPAGLDTGGGTGRVGVPGCWFLAAYDVLFVVYSLRCLVLFATLLGRHARRMPPSALRTGLRLMKASGVVGAVWTLWLLTDLVRVLRSGRQDTAEDPQSAVFALVCAVLAVGGATATVWGRVLTGPLRLLRAVRAYRALGPLWQALHEAHPGIALPATGERRCRPGTPKLREMQFALYRRVIEIHDGRLSLRPYYPADVSAWLAERGRTDAARAAADGSARSAAPDAVVEAATLAAAIEARRSGAEPPRRQAASTVPAGPRAGTIDGDVAWLTVVAEEFQALAGAAAGGRRGKSPGRDGGTRPGQ